jgi:small nuclear ribonucleoprotein (snRNP)-like protein
MQQNKVVIQLKNGTVRKGITNDFLPNKARFHFTGTDGSIEPVDIDTLKALFFVKDIDGNKDYKESYNDIIQGGGRKIRVEFADGEVIIGYVLGYSPDRPGFIMSPADSKGNNNRVFVVRSATKHIEFL